MAENYLIRFRVSHEKADDKETIDFYVSTFRNYIKYLELDIKEYVTGIHKEAKQLHFHTHFHCQGNIGKAVGMASLKNDIKKVKNPFVPPEGFFDYKIKQISAKTGKEVMINCFSIQFTKVVANIVDGDEKFEITRCLQYPLKENLLVAECTNTQRDLEQLTKNATAEFAASQVQLMKNKKKEKKAQDDLTTVFELMNEQGTHKKDFVGIKLDFIKHFREKVEKYYDFYTVEKMANKYIMKYAVNISDMDILLAQGRLSSDERQYLETLINYA